jgi:UDP-N-acetylglucosamine transferase subunit ALG13
LATIIWQIPKIIAAIRNEKKWLKKMIKVHKFDAVISDNRFGLSNKNILTIFLTHQLSIKTGLGEWTERFLQRWNYRYITRFDECWIPDLEGENNLAGALSHPAIKPVVPIKYIGLLSRLEKKESEQTNNHLLFMLSGPEPQRSILENKIVDDISHYPATATIVRGLPSSSSIIPSMGMIKFYNHLPAKELNDEMQKAEWVISRCGYSTVMDIVKLRKKNILIPTPGQTEQEYLAKYLKQKQIAFTTDQNEFSLSRTLAEAKRFNFRFFNFANSDELKKVVRNFFDRLSINLANESA